MMYHLIDILLKFKLDILTLYQWDDDIVLHIDNYNYILPYKLK